MQENNEIKKIELSIVVPILNEAENVEKLHARIVEECNRLNKTFEIIFVNDGSTDDTISKCKKLTPLKLITFRKRSGQTAGFDAGFQAAQGKIVITMDGDLQNDPADISKLLDKMNEGYDVVSGWRFERKDSISKKIFSRGANLLRKFFMNDTIHDSGCSLKAYKRECFNDLELFGEMHRFIPALLEIDGFKVAEVKVSHYARTAGVTKYNWKRAFKGFVDMVSIWFWRKFANRPLHLFGASGMMLSFSGVLILIWMFVEKVFMNQAIGERIWPMIGFMFVLVGMQLFISGLLADIMIKNYFKVKNHRGYNIKEIINN